MPGFHGFNDLQRIKEDLASHIPSDPTFVSAVQRFLRPIIDDLLANHPDNPANPNRPPEVVSNSPQAVDLTEPTTWR